MYKRNLCYSYKMLGFNKSNGGFITWTDFTYVLHQLQLQTDYYIQIITVTYTLFFFLKSV